MAEKVDAVKVEVVAGAEVVAEVEPVVVVAAAAEVVWIQNQIAHFQESFPQTPLPWFGKFLLVLAQKIEKRGQVLMKRMQRWLE